MFCMDFYLNGKIIPQETTVKYLGIHLDRRLTWKPHIHNKRIGINAATNVLDHRQKIQALSDQQTINTQNHIKPHLDVWYSIMGNGIPVKH